MTSLTDQPAPEGESTGMATTLSGRIREAPATIVLSALWILVFIAMVVAQVRWGLSRSPRTFLIGLQVGHWFGDMTIREFFAGEVWRAVTSTFVHYGLVHIGLNIVAFYLLGSMLEAWYGPGQFLGIYVLTGGVGNALSALVRRSLGWDPGAFSGGGSTVVMGLVGLCAVVGWRSHKSDDVSMRNAMISSILMTAGLGLVLSFLSWLFPRAGVPVLDNWGHAGGLVVGALIGLADLRMLRLRKGMWAKVAGVFSVLVLAASAAAQVKDARVEAQVVKTQEAESAQQRSLAAQMLLRQAAGDDYLMKRLEEIRQVYRAIIAERRVQRGTMVLANRRPVPAPATKAEPSAEKKAETKAETKAESKPAAPDTPPPANASSDAAKTGPLAPTNGASASANRAMMDAEQQFFLAVLAAAAYSLESMQAELDTGAHSADFRRARDLIRQTAVEQPTQEEVREVEHHLNAIRDRLRKDRDARTAQAQALAQPPRS